MLCLQACQLSVLATQLLSMLLLKLQQLINLGLELLEVLFLGASQLFVLGLKLASDLLHFIMACLHITMHVAV